MTHHQTHFFIAVPLAESVRTSIQNSTNHLKEQLDFKSWVHPEDYHITLAFLGNAPSEKLSALKLVLTTIVASHEPFQLELSDWGLFGEKNSPRIFWKGVMPSNELSMLQKDVYQACIDCGFKLDKKPFKPHITVARRWNSDQSFDLASTHSVLEDQRVWEVSDICLFQTHMKKTPKYETIQTFALADK